MVSDGEGGGGGGAEGGGGGTPADTLWVASSLAAHRALLSELNSAWLPAHGRSLAHAACVCALRPRPRTLSLAHHALLGVEALLRHASRATPHRAAALLAHVFWRASVLLYSDAIPLYSHAARVLAAVAAPPPHGSPLAATLGAAPLAAPTFTAALAATAPPFWASSPTEARASTNPFSPMPGGAVGGGGGGGDGGCARFPGLQLLLLRGAGEGRTRDACVRLARLCAACGGEASAALEAEGSRLLTAAALVLPSLRRARRRRAAARRRRRRLRHPRWAVGRLCGGAARERVLGGAAAPPRAQRARHPDAKVRERAARLPAASSCRGGASGWKTRCVRHCGRSRPPSATAPSPPSSPAPRRPPPSACSTSCEACSPSWFRTAAATPTPPTVGCRRAGRTCRSVGGRPTRRNAARAPAVVVVGGEGGAGVLPVAVGERPRPRGAE